MQRWAFLVIAAMSVAFSACGQGKAAQPAPADHIDDILHGLAFDLPPGWQRAGASLTPNLSDPREELAVGTFPMQYRRTACAHVAASALEDMGPGDAFVTLQERGIDPSSTWTDFPPRPAHFGPELGDRSEAAACAPGAQFTDYWFGFTDGDRHFHVLVAIGPAASDAVRREAWGILDSLQVDPAVRPDWRSCC